MRKKHFCKVILLGNSREFKSYFTENMRPTVGGDFVSRVISEGDSDITIQVWDTAGQEKFQSLGGAFYRGVDGIVLVYDITDSESFSTLNSWMENYYTHSQENKKVPVVVVGNKLDKCINRKVPIEQAEKWTQEKKYKFIEVSAKTSENVKTAFELITKDIIDHLENKSEDNFKTNFVALENKKFSENKENYDKSCACK